MNASQIISGLGWSAGATVINALGQFVFLAVLARLLDPATFGLLAMASIALRFSSFFAQFGFAQSLIQKPDLRPTDHTAALVMALALGFAFYAGTVIAAPAFAAYFRAPELVAVLVVLAVSLPLGAVGGLPMALLRRAGQFKRIAFIEVLSFVVGYGAVGMACASSGLGVWSLVAAALAQQSITLVLGFACARYTLAWPLQQASFRHLGRFGAAYSLVSFLEFLSANVESLFLGRVFGKASLGTFNRAVALVNLPVEQAVTAVNKVLFPALASMQTDRSRLADGFQMMLLGVGLFSTALACGIAAAAPDVVALLLGPKWVDAAPLLAIVAFAAPPMFMYSTCGVTLDSIGALRPKLKLQFATLIAKVALVFGLANLAGMPGVALAVVAAEFFRLAMGMRVVSQRLALGPWRCAQLSCIFLVEGALVFGAVAVAAWLANEASWPVAWRVVFEVLAGLCVVCAGALVLLARYPAYAPLQRFDTVRRWHGSALQWLPQRGSQ